LLGTRASTSNAMKREDWGLIEFSEAWRRQQEIADAILFSGADDVLVTCEHPAVITRGRSTLDSAMLASPALLESRGISLTDVNRGGEATAHNPGQLVCYPIVQLERYKPDLHWFLRILEDAVIETLQDFDLQAGRVYGLTGVWIEGSRKICAIGIHCRKWVTTHGLALNVCNDLRVFDNIIPCGITHLGVTSMSTELGMKVSVAEVRPVLVSHLERLLQHTTTTS
jgi:lipoyl(octanoyl) transferase